MAVGLGKSISQVWGCLQNMLVLIVEGKGGSDLIEQNIGTQF